jgi:hypothetical protein
MTTISVIFADPQSARLSARLRAGETPAERDQRLATVEAEKQRLTRQEAHEQHYAQFTFKPDLTLTAHVNEHVVRARSRSRSRSRARTPHAHRGRHEFGSDEDDDDDDNDDENENANDNGRHGRRQSKGGSAIDRRRGRSRSRADSPTQACELSHR